MAEKNGFQQTVTPPQLAYSTFKNKIRELAEEGGQLPATIDSTLFGKMSGTSRNQFTQALKFFELIDSKGAPSQHFQKMAVANEDGWKSLMKTLLQEYYREPLKVIQENGTFKQVQDAFGNIPSSALYTCSKFLFQACADVGISVPKHIIAANKAPVRGSRGVRAKKSEKSESSVAAKAVEPNQPPSDSEEWIDFPIHFPDQREAGLIRVPRKPNEQSKRFIAVALKAVADYFELDPKGGIQ